jgi:hypothetical protein
VVVIDSYAVHDHSTVVVILDAAGIALGAVVHSRKFIHFALFAESEFSLVLHLEVNH